MKKFVLFTAMLFTAKILIAQIIHIPADYPSIQEGINAACDGDTVLVHPGTYFENVNIENKSLTLGSLFLTTQDTSYMSQTVIDGGGAGNILFVSGSSNVRISGITITGGNCGIACLGSSNVIMEQLIITGNAGGFVLPMGAGVYISNCIDCLFKDVIISNNILKFPTS